MGGTLMSSATDECFTSSLCKEKFNFLNKLSIGPDWWATISAPTGAGELCFHTSTSFAAVPRDSMAGDTIAEKPVLPLGSLRGEAPRLLEKLSCGKYQNHSTSVEVALGLAGVRAAQRALWQLALTLSLLLLPSWEGRPEAAHALSWTPPQFTGRQAPHPPGHFKQAPDLGYCYHRTRGLGHVQGRTCSLAHVSGAWQAQDQTPASVSPGCFNFW